jgi:hypothetical protein
VEPTVAARIMPINVAPPSRATKPANGRTISDGIGGKRFSSATR